MLNLTLFQFFHWYYPKENSLWATASREASKLASLGVTHVWLPPAYKSAKGSSEPGYAVYDLYDLGEFEQKGTIATKHGSKDEYLDAINSFHQAGVKVLADVVFNHMMGGDEPETLIVQRVDAADRNKLIGEPYLFNANTTFIFPGRCGKHSVFRWDQRCFKGLCDNDNICLIHNGSTAKGWDALVGNQMGNYDYLMGLDIEFRNPAVQRELQNWGKWYVEHTDVDGFRLDALKHIPVRFFAHWLTYLDAHTQKPLLYVGEYWREDVNDLLRYLYEIGDRVNLFDVPLHFNLRKASVEKNEYDLRKIFKGSLVETAPSLAITFVDNHDTQPGQSLESFIEPWFQPHAYALILLRSGGTPCVFYPAVYGAAYTDCKDGTEITVLLEKVNGLETMMKLRHSMAFGKQVDYFDEPGIIGWTLQGDGEMPTDVLAVLLSNGDAGVQVMHVGIQNAGKYMHDVLNSDQTPVLINDHGDGVFLVLPASVSVYVTEQQTQSLQ